MSWCLKSSCLTSHFLVTQVPWYHPHSVILSNSIRWGENSLLYLFFFFGDAHFLLLSMALGFQCLLDASKHILASGTLEHTQSTMTRSVPAHLEAQRLQSSGISDSLSTTAINVLQKQTKAQGCRQGYNKFPCKEENRSQIHLPSCRWRETEVDSIRGLAFAAFQSARLKTQVSFALWVLVNYICI